MYVYELELHIADLNLIIIYTHIHNAAKSEHVSVLVLMNNGNGRCKDKESWAAEIRNALYNWKWPSLTDDKVSHTYSMYVCMCITRFMSQQVVSQSKISKRHRKISRMVFTGPLYSNGTGSRNGTQRIHNISLLSTSIAITILQHWVYHHRLIPAIDRAINTTSDGNGGSSGGTTY